MKKELWKILLTVIGAAWLLVACRTTKAVEKRVEHVESRRSATADSVELHTADTVMVFVERGDSIVRIIERRISTREKLKVVRDTVVIHARNDSIVKVEKVREQVSRSPPRWKLRLAILGLATIAILLAVKSKTIKHLLQL